MNSILYVAGIIKEKFRRMYGHKIEEIRLHKLLYFAQKESYIVYERPLFEEDMEGWIYGPVSTAVRAHFDVIPEVASIDAATNEIVDNVLVRYGGYSISSLIEATHKENAWRKSRNGLLANERGVGIIKKDDIAGSVRNEMAVCELWGCEYDEFEDAF